jgi:hypothetical protein
MLEFAMVRIEVEVEYREGGFEVDRWRGISIKGYGEAVRRVPVHMDQAQAAREVADLSVTNLAQVIVIT